jgi:hypothetical protein
MILFKLKHSCNTQQTFSSLIQSMSNVWLPNLSLGLLSLWSFLLEKSNYLCNVNLILACYVMQFISFVKDGNLVQAITML